MASRRDGKHPVPCVVCGTGHYRMRPFCSKCQPADLMRHRNTEQLKAYVERLPLDVLEACVDEYRRRAEERLAVVRSLTSEAA